MAAPTIELVRVEADVTDELRWNTPSVVKLLHSKNIRSRGELARRIGVSRSVVNAAFDEDWRGRATSRLIARLACFFEVLVDQLIVDPAAAPTRPAVFEFETTDPEVIGPQNGRRAKAGQTKMSEDPDGVLLVTRREAARRLSLSETEIDEARRRGDLAAQRYGSKVLISVNELRRFAESLPADER
jgi:hypothetical protein